MESMEGYSVDDLWFDSNGPTPLEERRLRILKTLASAMSQLNRFWSTEIGSPEFADDTSIPTYQPCLVDDEAAQMECMRNGIDKIIFREAGPFQTCNEYFETLLAMQAPAVDSFTSGIHKLVRIMIQLIPPSPDFVLAHPDLDVQNVLVSEDGTLTALARLG